MAAPEISPVALVQNPAFGSLLLWKFGRGFQAERVGELPVLTPFFLALPLVLYGPTMRIIKSTNQSSGLAKFVSKLAEEREAYDRRGQGAREDHEEGRPHSIPPWLGYRHPQLLWALEREREAGSLSMRSSLPPR